MNHHRDLLNQLEKVDAVLRVAIDYLLTLDVTQVILKDLFSEQIDERLNVFCHLCNILACSQLRKIYLRECSLEELNVEFITEEDRHVIDGLFHTQVPQYFISELDDHLHDYII